MRPIERVNLLLWGGGGGVGNGLVEADGLFADLIAAVLHFFQQLLHCITFVFKGPEEAVRAIASLIAAVLHFFQQFFHSISSFFKGAEEAVKGAMASLIAAVLHFFQQILHSISSFFMGAEETVKGATATLIAAVLHFFQQLLHSISSFFKGVEETVKRAMASFKGPILYLFNLLVDQFSGVLRLWGDIAASLVGKLEEALPPEHPGRPTLLVLVQLAMAVVLILGLVLLPYIVCAFVALVRALAVCLRICFVAARKLFLDLVVGIRQCARGAWKMVMACYRSLKLRSKMMKAPGRPDMSIQRVPFEANPKAYFTAFRASARASRMG